jgi:hypothetical protein
VKVIDSIRREKTRRHINIRIPVALYERFVKQMHIDKEMGYKPKITNIVILYLDERENPRLKQRFMRVLHGQLQKRHFTGRTTTTQL